MDCLDRTNVVQYYWRWVLQNQFTETNYLLSNNVTSLKIESQFNLFSKISADNADAVSVLFVLSIEPISQD